MLARALCRTFLHQIITHAANPHHQIFTQHTQPTSPRRSRPICVGMAPSKPQNTRSLASRLSAQSRKSFRGPRRTPVIPLSAETTRSLCKPRRVNITSRPISSATSNVVCSQARVGGQTQRSTTPDFGPNDDDDDVQDSVIAVIDRNGQNTVGCAVYHAREGLLRCMEDVKEIDGGLFDTRMNRQGRNISTVDGCQ